LGGLTFILIQSFANVVLSVSGLQIAVVVVVSLVILVSLLIKTRG